MGKRGIRSMEVEGAGVRVQSGGVCGEEVLGSLRVLWGKGRVLEGSG